MRKNAFVDALHRELGAYGLELTPLRCIARHCGNDYWLCDLRSEGNWVCIAILIDFEGEGYELCLPSKGITHADVAEAAQHRATHYAQRLPAPVG